MDLWYGTRKICLGTSDLNLKFDIHTGQVLYRHDKINWSDVLPHKCYTLTCLKLFILFISFYIIAFEFI